MVLQTKEKSYATARKEKQGKYRGKTQENTRELKEKVEFSTEKIEKRKLNHIKN